MGQNISFQNISLQIRAIRIRTVDILGHAERNIQKILELLYEPNMPLSWHWAPPPTCFSPPTGKNKQLLINHFRLQAVRWFRVLEEFPIYEATPKCFEKGFSVDTGLLFAYANLFNCKQSLSPRRKIRYFIHLKVRITRKRSQWGPRIAPTILSIKWILYLPYQLNRNRSIHLLINLPVMLLFSHTSLIG